jgi:hypothetical protein
MVHGSSELVQKGSARGVLLPVRVPSSRYCENANDFNGADMSNNHVPGRLDQRQHGDERAD